MIKLRKELPSAHYYDFSLVLACTVLMVISIFFIYSSGVVYTPEGEATIASRKFLKQIFFNLGALSLIILFSFLNLKYFEKFAWGLYIFMILILFLTLKYGIITNGARSWLSFGPLRLQISEFGKIITVIILARYLKASQEKNRSFFFFITVCLIGFLPALLVAVQPDLGSALVYFVLTFTLLFIGGAPLRYIGFLFFLFVFSTVFAILPAWGLYAGSGIGDPVFSLLVKKNYIPLIAGSLALIILLALSGRVFFSKHYFYWITYGAAILLFAYLGAYGMRSVLKGYQIKRMLVFLNPEIDPTGAGWHIIQSLTAVGSGGPFGKGFIAGTQSHYSFLPQQSTDFIFSLIAEEKGFLGGLVIFFLYAFIFYRIFRIMLLAKDPFGIYFCGGYLGLLSFHFFENIGMTIGIMPITGIPLLFLSYGGSSVWAASIGIGIIVNIFRTRYKTL